MVRIDRRSGKRVYGAWPGNEPKAAVIWEAFKPDSEPRRVGSVSNGSAAGGPNRRVRSDAEFMQLSRAVSTRLCACTWPCGPYVRRSSKRNNRCVPRHKIMPTSSSRRWTC